MFQGFALFTGLIEQIGTVKDLRQGAGAARLTVDLGDIASELVVGESVSVNGVCLTVVAISGTEAAFDVVRETLSRSALARLAVGERVNIERALRADGRLGGHFVQGHVDGVGRISRIHRSGGATEVEISAPREVLELIVPKGSIAVDGISLTVARRRGEGFTVAIIPHTLENTTLGSAKPGDSVNLETDILGKYAQALLRGRPRTQKELTEDLLRESGFM
ncbi:MAG: riboflavin synthase [Armatimonadota bacterium]|nr:riboflavin synthase [Armatimonadota bacterium]